MKRLPLLQQLKLVFPQLEEKELFTATLCGEIYVDGECIRDPQFKVSPQVLIERSRKKYVSRGGLKLERALDLWRPPVEGRVLLDAGSSTGGFTDCLLQRGAKAVYAVDVGHNQLDYTLRMHSSVVVMEKRNILSFSPKELKVDWAVADLSFRSLRGVASHILTLTKEGRLIALMKPQFETPKGESLKGGVVRSAEELLAVGESLYKDLEKEGCSVQALCASPIRGRKGNQEFLLDLCRGGKMDLSVLMKDMARELGVDS